ALRAVARSRRRCDYGTKSFRSGVTACLRSGALRAGFGQGGWPLPLDSGAGGQAAAASDAAAARLGRRPARPAAPSTRCDTDRRLLPSSHRWRRYRLRLSVGGPTRGRRETASSLRVNPTFLTRAPAVLALLD